MDFLKAQPTGRLVLGFWGVLIVWGILCYATSGLLLIVTLAALFVGMISFLVYLILDEWQADRL